MFYRRATLNTARKMIDASHKDLKKLSGSAWVFADVATAVRKYRDNMECFDVDASSRSDRRKVVLLIIATICSRAAFNILVRIGALQRVFLHTVSDIPD